MKTKGKTSKILSSFTTLLRTARLLAALAVVLGWTLLDASQIFAQPAPPSDLTATTVSTSQINLQWVNNPPLGTEIRVYRSPDGNTFIQVATLNRTATTYSDTNLLDSAPYFYQVRAHNLAGDSGPSNTASDATFLSLQLDDILPGAIALAWRGSSADDHYDVQRCTNQPCRSNNDFSVIATVPAPASGYADTGLADGVYSYRVQTFRTSGPMPISNPVRATLGGTGGIIIDHSSGFSTHDDLTNNGTAVFTGDNTARLTLNQANESGTIFSNDGVGIEAFNASFTFRIHDPSTPPADGLTFIIQNDDRGARALGPGGGGLAFGPDNRNTAGCQNTDPMSGSIRKSVAIKFDIYDNGPPGMGEGDNSTGIFTDGRSPTIRCPGLSSDFPDMSVDLRGSQIELKDDHVKQVDLTYDGTTLTETITDLQTMGTFTTAYVVDIPTLVGGGTAYVGFGGATGGLFAVQEILTWTFSGPSSNLPRPPKGLRVTNVNGSDVTIGWKFNNAQTAQGFDIERADNGGDFTQISTVDITQTSFTDQALADGTYCYRVRSFNDQGNSGYSNVYCLSVPVPNLVDHSGGFAIHDDLKGNTESTRNIFTAGVARLTTGGFGQAGTVFTTSRVDITQFTSTFNLLICVTTPTCATAIPAEGITFTIQGNAPTARGNNGGSLGYGGIGNSVAVKLDIFDNQGETDNSTGLFTGGHFPGLASGIGDVNVPIDKSVLDLKSGDLFQVDMAYDATTLTLTVTITDTVTGSFATQAYTVDIPSQVGSKLGYVGLTGATGSSTARQDIQTWTFQSGMGTGARKSKTK